VVKIDLDYNNNSIKEIVFFKIESLDTSKVQLFNTVNGYCINSICEIPSFRGINNNNNISTTVIIILLIKQIIIIINK